MLFSRCYKLKGKKFGGSDIKNGGTFMLAE